MVVECGSIASLFGFLDNTEYDSFVNEMRPINCSKPKPGPAQAEPTSIWGQAFATADHAARCAEFARAELVSIGG